MIQIVFGWPGIVAFLVLASAAAWLPSYRLMMAALVLCLPSSLYLFGGNGWVQGMALYVPICLLGSTLLIRKGNSSVPKLLLLPVYVFYAYLAKAVFAQ